MFTYKHHLLPKHVTVWNEPINIWVCTAYDHSEAHRLLWETFNYYEDYIEWKAWSGIIGKEKILRELQLLGSYRGAAKIKGTKRPGIGGCPKGKPKSESHKQKIREARAKQSPPNTGMRWKIKDTSNVVSSKGTYWYNNGVLNIRSLSCPAGFIKGRIKWKNL